MINLPVLYELNEKVQTMYGIFSSIKNDFAVLMVPSIGTIKPALKRMEAAGFISSQKFMSKGGRPSTYYAITEQGKTALKAELLSPLPENPAQFLVNARLRLICADVLNMEDVIKLFRLIKFRTESFMIDAQRLVEDDNTTFYPKMVFDNMTCEYKNFYSLVEGMEHACMR